MPSELSSSSITASLGQRREERRPAAVRLELRVAAEQLGAAGPAAVDALGLGVGVLAGERRARCRPRAARGTPAGVSSRAPLGLALDDLRGGLGVHGLQGRSRCGARRRGLTATCPSRTAARRRRRTRPPPGAGRRAAPPPGAVRPRRVHGVRERTDAVEIALDGERRALLLPPVQVRGERLGVGSSGSRPTRSSSNRGDRCGRGSATAPGYPLAGARAAATRYRRAMVARADVTTPSVEPSRARVPQPPA